jgi:hypothetical protein
VTPDKPGKPPGYEDFDAEDDGSDGAFFRGAELSRLLVLVAIMVVGWLVVWRYMRHKGEAPPEPEPVVVTAPPRVEPDKSPAFESVTDWTPIGLRDMGAYDLLLKRAREAGANDLARQSRRDILYTDLWERPGRYRGVPVHLLGTAWRIHSYESRLSPSGRLYEAWIGTNESQNNPYVCVFEDLPKGMPVGPDSVERVVFNGYFLKEMRYLSGQDIKRGAPVLIGKIGWTPPQAERRVDSTFWMALIVGIMFLISLFRWIRGLRRSLSRPSLARSLGRRPREEIAPEELSEWVESVREEGEPDPESGHAHEPKRDDR